MVRVLAEMAMAAARDTTRNTPLKPTTWIGPKGLSCSSHPVSVVPGFGTCRFFSAKRPLESVTPCCTGTCDAARRVDQVGLVDLDLGTHDRACRRDR